MAESIGTEFTGERVIPHQVEPDLWNEHYARYVYAANLCVDGNVLDLGCGAGYGTALLAQHSRLVVGLDRAAEAVTYAQEHYRRPNLAFVRGDCEQIPLAGMRFDVITAFEVIEHLADWRALLREAKRLLSPNGLLLVSTPNRLFYAESRAAAGPNPFHVHEFTYAEYCQELSRVFPHVQLLVQNHAPAIVFAPVQGAEAVWASLEGSPAPDDGHFYLAVCGLQPLPVQRGLVFVPSVANSIHEQQAHIAALQDEVEKKTRWLDEQIQQHTKLLAEHRSLVDLFRDQQQEMEEISRWGGELNLQWEERGQRIQEMQRELEAMSRSYEAKIRELERDVRARTEWARGLEKEAEEMAEAVRSLPVQLQQKCDELFQAVEALHRTEKSLEERTEWGFRLTEELNQLRFLVQSVSASRWVRLGRRLGVGPRLPSGSPRP